MIEEAVNAIKTPATSDTAVVSAAPLYMVLGERFLCLKGSSTYLLVK